MEFHSAFRLPTLHGCSTSLLHAEYIQVFVRDCAGCKMFGFLGCRTGLPSVSVAATRCASCFASAVRQCHCSYHCGYYFVFQFRIAADDEQSWLVLNETAKVLYPNTVSVKCAAKLHVCVKFECKQVGSFIRTAICTCSLTYAALRILPQIIQDIFQGCISMKQFIHRLSY